MKKKLKLQLNRETLRRLDSRDFEKIQGGTSWLCTHSCNVFECPIVWTEKNPESEA